jgi:hypothetical protein
MKETLVLPRSEFPDTISRNFRLHRDLPTRYKKQVALSLVQKRDGVDMVDSQVEVVNGYDLKK